MQAFNPAHPVLQEVLKGDFAGFIRREMSERQEFRYPPFTRLIHLTLRHKDARTVHDAAAFFGKLLKEKLGERVLGPVLPHIPRVRGLYAENIMLKLEKSAPLLANAKTLIRHSTEIMLGRQGFGQVLVAVDVDPVYVRDVRG